MACRGTSAKQLGFIDSRPTKVRRKLARALVRLSANAPGRISPLTAGTLEIPLRRQNGVLFVPAMIDGVIDASFVVDSGASSVVIPEALAQVMRQAGKLSDSDFTGSEVHRIADGSTFRSRTFFIRSLKIGNTVLENVRASLAFGRGFPLLGQSLLQRFSSWAIDNDRQVLVLKVL